MRTSGAEEPADTAEALGDNAELSAFSETDHATEDLTAEEQARKVIKWSLTQSKNRNDFLKVVGSVRDVLTVITDEATSAHEDWEDNVTELLDNEDLLDGKRQELYDDGDHTKLPTLRSVIPQKHVIPNNKMANSLKDIIDIGSVDLMVDARKSIATRCVVAYEGPAVKLSSRQPFTEYDRCVADAVTSLYLYGDQSHIITASAVYRAMVHATDGETPSPQQIGAVTRSLDKMRFVRVQIDCSEELRSRKISLDGEWIIGGQVDTYLLSLEKVQVEAGGRTVAAYRILRTPILYDYAHMTKQVLTLPASLLEITDACGTRVANTEQRIIIRDYLLRRIAVMKGKGGSKMSRSIVYETLFSEIGEIDPNKKKRQHIREYVETCLDSWTRAKFIHGYNIMKSGRFISGVEIIV